MTPRINSGGKFHRIQVFYFSTDESGGLYPLCFRSPPNPQTQHPQESRLPALAQTPLLPQGLMVLFYTRSRGETERSPARYRQAASELLAVGGGGCRR
ncbi:hypothetical protein [Microcoleus sp. Pol10D4]|uniref:hypothetical protein n=1 Tax=Microcoleus sp. Pol10D4 TaxID=3055387 RepID=UPI002FD18072